MTDMGLLITQLQQAGRLADDVAAELRAALLEEQRDETSGRRLAGEIVGYLGAVLVVVAIVLVIGSRWSAWSSVTRQGVLAAVAVALLIVASIIGCANDTRRRLAGVLGAVAIVPGAAWPAVGLLPPWDQRVWPAVAMAIAFWSYTRARSMLGLGSMVITSAMAAGIWLSQLQMETPRSLLGAAFILLGFLWLVLGGLQVVTELETTAVAGSALVLIGSQMPITDNFDYPAYGVAGVIAAVLIYSYLKWYRRMPVLGAGIMGLGLVAGELVFKLTGGDVFGAAMGMLVAGAVMLVLSLRLVRTLPTPN
ncbi:MAG: DUF2157 domain-containing protein [Candidatus Nanopelagicales bacterium]